MKKNTITNIKAAVVLALVCSVLIGMARFETKCQALRDNILRLHIVANSDSDFDQQLKLKVRDAVLSETKNLFEQATDLDFAIAAARQSVPEIVSAAQQVLKDAGVQQSVSVDIGDAYFDTREYDTFTLPAGTYKAVNIRLGEAKGKNWWCVMFPALCIGASCAALEEVSGQGAEIATNSSKYVMRFKTVEIYEQIKQYFLK